MLVGRSSTLRAESTVGIQESMNLGASGQRLVLTMVSHMSGDEAPAARILLAEDEMLVAMDVEACLQDEGYLVCGIAATAAEAVDLAAKFHPHVAIME
jgi:PleD family two-component response regulator